MSPSEAEDSLDSILKNFHEKSRSTLLPDEIALLITSFLPTTPFSTRSKAYMALTAFCSRVREASPRHHKQSDESDLGTQSIVLTFSTPFSVKLGGTTEPEVLAALTFLTALFQVDSQSASAILQQDGVVESLTDIFADLFPNSPTVSLAIAQLVGQAAGHKASRGLIPSQCVEWLETVTRRKDSKSHLLRAAAAVALIKLSKGNAADAANASITGSAQPNTSTLGGGDEELVKVLKGLVLDNPTEDNSAHRSDSSLGDAIEGLAYMSVDPIIKEQLSSDQDFLKRLFSTIPKKKGAWAEASEEEIGLTPLYGVVLIVANLCAYKPKLSEEEAQIAKLRRMARTPTGGGSNASEEPEINPLEDDAHALERGRRIIRAGALDALSAAVRASDSRAVRLLAGKAYLSLVEDKDNRGRVLQGGGAKALHTIIQNILSKPAQTINNGKLPQLEQSEIEPIQALAKLAITSSPVQVFGPNPGATLDAIRPFSVMLVHPNSTLLQQFEAIMALTNIASESQEASEKIAKAEGLLNKVELLMLEDHTLIRRASTELICNLVAGSEEVFNRYGGDRSSGASGKSKLQVLVALCDVDDLQTRLASSGAVAYITSSPDACQSLYELQQERHRILPILSQLVDPSIIPPADPSNEEAAEEEAEGTRKPTEGDPGLIHRGVVCIRNLLTNVQEMDAKKNLSEEAHKLGLVQALARVFRDNSADKRSPVLRPTAEALKIMMECGITITV
ncbi:Armadillo-like helical [Abortiporus biennis]